jgi:hypothetical protein
MRIVNRSALMTALLTAAAGLIFPCTPTPAASPSTSSIVQEKPVQPWGTDELTAARKGEPASFPMPGTVNATTYTLTGEVRLSELGDTFSFQDIHAAIVQQPRTKTLALELAIGHNRNAPRTAMLLTNGNESAWLPLSIARLGNHLTVSLGSLVLERHLSAGALTNHVMALWLQNGAKARNLAVTTCSPEMTPLNLRACAAEPGTNTAAIPLAPPLDATALPAGLVTVGGVPFVLGDPAVDVRLSMAGANFSRRLKYGYYTAEPSPYRPVLTAPGTGYEALHVLAYSRRLPGHVPRMTVGIGRCVGWAGLMAETVVPVPDLREGGESEFVQARVAVTLPDGTPGWLYHLRIPAARGADAWFVNDTQFEFSRDKQDLHNLPDPNEFARVPAGLPSAVVVLAATAERAPAGFAFVPGEPGNVFFENQTPTLTFRLTNRLDRALDLRLTARSAGPGTTEEFGLARTEWTVDEAVSLKPGQARDVPIKVMPKEHRKRGWFDLEIGVETGGRLLHQYRTTYAVLAPDTRKAMADSPFGVWEFWWPHASFSSVFRDRHAQDAASLILKGGWRWTYGGTAQSRNSEDMTAENLFQRYKLTYTIRGLHQSYQREEGWWNAAEFEEKAAASLREKAGKPAPGLDPVIKVLHESRSSTAIIRRFGEFFGGAPYDMPAKEKEQIDRQFSNVVAYCRAIKAADPAMKICLINDYPQVGIEYMKRGMPKDAFDYFGTEGANFMREPERQPDWLSLLAILHSWKRAREHYGYLDKPVWTTEALYHGTNPDNLSLHAQAVIQVREAMLALANGVGRMCAAGLLRDSTDDYRWSNWGSAGLCFREPEMNPKPSYAMHAWLTQILDQRAYAGRVSHDSTSLHILDFAGADGAHVYPVWCVRGRQDLSLAVEGRKPVVFDAYGNPMAADVRDGRLAVTVSDTPLYITGVRVTAVAERRPVEIPAEPGRTLIAFDQPGLATAAQAANPVLEANWDYPRLKGDYAVDLTEEDGVKAIRLELRDDADPRKLLQRYVELVLDKPVAIPNRVRAFTARVKGNGSWARLMFEFRDAEGRVWTACGNQYPGSCNASDNRGDSYVSFDGWQTMTIAAPGRLPATDLVAFASSTCHWWPENTPEWQRQLAAHTKAVAAYEQAAAEYPALKQTHAEALQAHETALAAYKQDKAAFDKAQSEFTAAKAAYAKALTAFQKEKAAHDQAVKAGKAKAEDAPQAPVEPAAPTLKTPTPPGEAPKAPAEPKKPGEPRNVGIAEVTYPITLTKVIVGMPPSVLYIEDEVPVANRSILIERIGALDWE